MALASRNLPYRECFPAYRCQMKDGTRKCFRCHTGSSETKPDSALVISGSSSQLCRLASRVIMGKRHSTTKPQCFPNQKTEALTCPNIFET